MCDCLLRVLESALDLHEFKLSSVNFTQFKLSDQKFSGLESYPKCSNRSKKGFESVVSFASNTLRNIEL